MKSRIKGLFAVVIVLSGVIVGSLGFSDQSLAKRTDTFTGKIDFDMYMDDGSLIPAGKVPTATVDYGVREYDQEWPIKGAIVYHSDGYINEETITIPYNGAGTYTASKTDTWTTGMMGPSGSLYQMRGIAKWHSFHNLKFTNVPAYIRTISANSTVLGDYSRYTYEYDSYKGPIGNENIPYETTIYNGNTAIANPNLIRVSPGVFNYQGDPRLLPSEQHPNSVEFTLVGGRPSATPGANWMDLVLKFSSVASSGKKITFFMKEFQTTEYFRDETGSAITPPSGFTQLKKTDADSDLFTHTMKKLPTSYTNGGYLYTLQGWYQGPTKPGTLNTTNPPSMTVDYTQPKNMNQLDQDGYLTVVYQKRKAHVLQEKYVDQSDGSLNSGSWDTSDSVIDGDNFTGTPAATKTDSSGADWEYTGWKEGISGTVNAKSVPVTINNVTGNKEIYYIYKKKTHLITEKWVDQADGSTVIPRVAANPKISSFDDNDSFNFSPAATIADTSFNSWDYVGWENVTDAPGVINYNNSVTLANIKGNKEFRYHYQARKTTATLDLKPTPQIVDSGDTVSWSSKLTNTGGSDLKDLILKSTSNWAAGLTDPVKVTVTPAGGAPQDFTVNSGDWATGVNLTGISIPKNGPNNYADITFTTTATGAVNQVLLAEIEVDGNIPTPLKAENFVRIDDQDEPNLLPSGNSGLLNIPNFKFGEVEVKPFAQRKGLDSSEYSNPSYNPYIRYMDNESIGTYSLSVKMGPFTSGSKTLPAATSIILGTGTVKEVQNYNKPNETLSAGSSIGPMRIESDNTTSIIHLGNTQGVYQIDYDFNDVELDLVAHSGIAGLDYKAVMDWTLTTAP